VLTRYLGRRGGRFRRVAGAGDGRRRGDQAAGHRRFGGAACDQPGRTQSAVRGRTGRAARHRSRHLPFVTSSNCVAGQAAAGSGIGPGMLHYVLGITKAYCTRVGGGPFPSELDIETAGLPGTRCRKRGVNSVPSPGRKRRCGWLDAAALKRSIQINGVTGLCITKLDVLDGLPELKICPPISLTESVDLLPMGADEVAACEPMLETCPAGPSPRSASARWRPCRQRRVPIWSASRNSAGCPSTSSRPDPSAPRRWSAVIHWGDRESSSHAIGSPRRAGRE
jgi:hypothetical protein